MLTAWVAILTIQRYALPAAARIVHATGRTAPAGMPADFPIYPGGKVVQGFTSIIPGSAGVIIDTPDPQAKVWAFYKAVLTRYPWKVNLSLSAPLHEISCLHLSNPQLSCSLVVDSSPDGMTEITFTWVPLTVKPR